MVRKLLIALSVIACAALGGSAAALAWGAGFAGPGPGVTGIPGWNGAEAALKHLSARVS